MRVLMDLWQKMSALIVWSLLLFCHWQMREKVFVEKRVLACQKELFSGARETSFWNDQGTSQGESLPNAATLIFEAQIKKTAEVGHKSAKHLCFNLGRLGAVGVTMGCTQSSKHPLRNSVSYLIYSNALGFHWCMLKISSDSFKKRERPVTKAKVNHLFNVTPGANFTNKICHRRKNSKHKVLLEMARVHH